jgi:hypothetical protein
MYFWISTIKGKYEYVGAISVKIRCPLHSFAFLNLAEQHGQGKNKGGTEAAESQGGIEGACLVGGA